RLNRSDVTPENLFLNRRKFLETSIYAGSGLATYSVYKYFRGSSNATSDNLDTTIQTLGPDSTTSFRDITNYNNFYEFSTDKEGVADASKNWNIDQWTLEVSGLVESPQSFSLEDLLKFKTEERIYRFRCVEGWSMVIPWLGFPLARMLEKARPLANAKFVAFESFYDKEVMPDALSSGIHLPYVEGLRLDEAFHPLTLLSTGLYGKNLMNQNGAPIRLVVPWKYGFKSIKSIVKIVVSDMQPSTTWNLINPTEYGFFSNVNPDVDHPRWSQASERRIGEFTRRPTLPFNGYADQVAKMYAGLDLKRYF
ncbi:MAG: protein-methionine-sulfoxide reductase catalytic subunit MsrP, partial [Proteobacteria bacterium]|nr:protein-methionine-sulfoxide reductase catalytic subunit MsrP [Pseudomonadota bacterium]